MSVPYAIVPTYTARPSLSDELSQKLTQPCRGGGIGHAVAVTGLVGTGKTQLVLHHIKEHEGDYHTILWVDGRSEETARWSFVRCCHDLGLPCEVGSDQVRLQDVPMIRTVLQYLQAQATDRQRMMIMDNADDLSWKMSSIVP